MYKTIKKIQKHIGCVQSAIACCISELQQRAYAHDTSKFQEDELKGYARFEEMPEGLEYGSEEHKAAMAKVMEGNSCFQLHSQRNDHHPEYHDYPEGGSDLGMMGLFPLIEMVCDWAGAHLAYGNKGSWFDSVDKNIAKYDFDDNQKWVIRQVSDFLRREIPELQPSKVLE